MAVHEKMPQNHLKFSKVAPKLDLKTCFRQRLIAILSSYEIKLVAKRDSELKVSTQEANVQFALRDDTGCCHSEIISYSNTCHF